MTIAQIEAFLAVSRHGKVRDAAEREHVSQPALTARIHALELELGAPLFHRFPRGMGLTPVGRAFLPYAERALAALESGSAVVAEFEQGVAGEVIVGAAASVSTYVLPEILARFTEQRPRVRVSIRIGHPDEIVQMVALGEVQVGITRECRDPRVATEPLYDDELLLVAPPGISRDADVMRALRTSRFILFEPASGYWDVTGALLEHIGIPRPLVMELDNIAAVKRMVRRGLGVALLPATAVADALTRGDLISLELPGVLPVRRPIVLVSRCDMDGW